MRDKIFASPLNYPQRSAFSMQFAIFCLLAAACSRCSIHPSTRVSRTVLVTLMLRFFCIEIRFLAKYALHSKFNQPLNEAFIFNAIRSTSNIQLGQSISLCSSPIARKSRVVIIHSFLL